MSEFKFIDLFVGIGGTRIAFEKAGGQCVFTSEKDGYAQRTYTANFPDHDIYGDITKFNGNRKSEIIPDHDVLVAGFPCQPFSLAGVSKNVSMSRPHGFEHKTAGTMFGEILQILRLKKPKAFLLENVKNLAGHNKGDTFRVIKDSLGPTPNGLGYKVQYRIYDSVKFVPQHRERIFIVGFLDNDAGFDFDRIDRELGQRRRNKSLKSILDDDPIDSISDGLFTALKNHKQKHLNRGNGFGYSVVDPKKRGTITRTLSARYYKDGAEILIEMPGQNPRKLSPDECKRLMGFPKAFRFPVSDSQAYKQLGNSVVVPLVTVIAKEMATFLK